MKVKPVTEDQALALQGGVLPKGRYPFKVKSAKEKVSSNGNDQIALMIVCHGTNVWDYLVNTPKWQWKIRHFADSIGRLQDYEVGELQPSSYVGLTGEVELDVEEAKGDYKAKNIVIDYVKREEQGDEEEIENESTGSMPLADFEDSDLPF